MVSTQLIRVLVKPESEYSRAEQIRIHYFRKNTISQEVSDEVSSFR